MKASLTPLISCIMPTRNRHEWVERAIENWQAQDYPTRELLIIDDEDADSCEGLIPADPRIIYRRVNGSPTIGWKRNYACWLARGNVIAHWDDDDWSGPNRLAEQYTEMRRHRVAVVGYNACLFYWMEQQRAFLYKAPASYAVGTSLMYQRAYWCGHKFEDVQIGEDNAFVHGIKPGSLYAYHGRQIVARMHAGNTCRKEDKIQCSPWVEIDPCYLPEGFPRQ